MTADDITLVNNILLIYFVLCAVACLLAIVLFMWVVVHTERAEHGALRYGGDTPRVGVIGWFGTLFGALDSWFVIGAGIAVAAVTAWATWAVVSNHYQAEYAQQSIDYATCRRSNMDLTKALDEQSARVRDLSARSEATKKEADTKLHNLEAELARADKLVAQVLASKPGTDACINSNQLIIDGAP